MNNDEQCLAYLLSVAKAGEKINKTRINNINWDIIFEMVMEQDIYAFLYPTIKDMDDNLKPKNQIMCQWKKATILASLIQVRNINRLSSVLKILNHAKIEVIGLKGVAIRGFYPVKELRTMIDTDILIHIEDLDEAVKILLELGYFEKNRNSKHILFLHKRFLAIELHWLLLDVDRFKNADYMEKIIWEDVKEINVNGASLLIPTLENQLLHLCFHMASHFIYSGFGLRQLCDLVILVEKQRDNVNWDSFYEKVKRCKIENFVIAIFEVCRRLFNTVVPNILYDSDLENNNEYIDMIIRSIFTGGVYGGIYGKMSMGPVDDNLLNYYESNSKYHNFNRKFKYIIGIFFPTKRRLSNRYNYAKEHPIFIPIAWVHRLIYGIFRKDFKMDKKRLLFLSKSDFFKKRIDLFKWLEL